MHESTTDPARVVAVARWLRDFADEASARASAERAGALEEIQQIDRAVDPLAAASLCPECSAAPGDPCRALRPSADGTHRPLRTLHRGRRRPVSRFGNPVLTARHTLAAARRTRAGALEQACDQALLAAEALEALVPDALGPEHPWPEHNAEHGTHENHPPRGGRTT